jgi:hypothetical protein
MTIRHHTRLSKVRSMVLSKFILPQHQVGCLNRGSLSLILSELQEFWVRLAGHVYDLTQCLKVPCPSFDDPGCTPHAAWVPPAPMGHHLRSPFAWPQRSPECIATKPLPGRCWHPLAAPTALQMESSGPHRCQVIKACRAATGGRSAH